MELTFNWVYADDRSIAQFTSGRLPVRPPTVDPGLPTKGTGEYEWQGFVPASAHAQTINPSSGVILNWNNKPARGYAGADDEWTWGPVQRVDLLWAGIQRRQKHTLATRRRRDERRRDAGPAARCASGRSSATCSPGRTGRRARTAAAAQLDAWYAAGGSRLDANLDGKVDAPGAAVMDAAWGPIANAVLAPVLDAAGTRRAREARAERPAARSDGLERVQRLVVVRPEGPALASRPPVAGAFETRFCGAATSAKCAASLWAALDTATAQLEATQGADAVGVARRRDRRADPASRPGSSRGRCAARTSRRSSRRSRFRSHR